MASKKHSPCAPHLFLPLDGADPRTYQDKQSSRLALTSVQKLHSSLARRRLGTSIAAASPDTVSAYSYVLLCLNCKVQSFPVPASLKKRRSPLTGCFLLRLGAGCWMLGAGCWVGGGAAAHRLCGGRSWQLLGHGRWLRGRMGLPGLAVFDLRWGRRRKRGAWRPCAGFFLRLSPPPSSEPSRRCRTMRGRC